MNVNKITVSEHIVTIDALIDIENFAYFTTSKGTLNILIYL